MCSYDVFLSYTRPDAAAAEQLRTRLAEAGLRAFLDRYALPVGQPWLPQLEAALAGCRALIVLLGPSGLGGWQQREINIGVERQATAGATAPFPLIPVLLPGLQPEDIPRGRFLGLNTWIDLRRGVDDPEALQRLVLGAQGHAIDGGATDKLLKGLSPYRGLLPFREQDAGLFFGRERFVDELVTKVRQRAPANTVAVVGRSGSGKSSIVYAGLFPALRKEKGVGQEAVWDIVSLRPLAEPLHQLARIFAPPLHGADPIAARDMLNGHAERFRQGNVTVAQLVRDRLQAETGSTRLLLYVDQWEELYTQGQPGGINIEGDRRHARDAKLFVDLLLDAAASAPCTLVLSVRSDFYPDLQNHDALRAAVQDSQVSLGPMSQAELRAAIEGPARVVGSRVHPDLTARLIRDIGIDVTAPGRDQYDIGKLPLLEYALEQAWTRRAGAEIGLGHYAGLEQALEERANQLYDRLSPAQQLAAKRLFVSLVTPGEGREDTRARIILPPDPATLAVVETFAGSEARLIVTGDAQGSRSAEVSHEALIRHWEKLRNWIEQNREKLRTRAALMAARAEWDKQKRHPNLLIEPGLRLEAARQLRDQPGDVVIDEVKDYIEASFARDTRRRLWRTGAFAAVAAVAVAMAGLAWVAQDLKQQAEMSEARAVAAAADATSLRKRAETALAERLEAETSRLADTARKQVDAGRPEIGIQLALAALASHAEGTAPPPSRWRAIDALAWSISAGPRLLSVLPHTAHIYSASFSPDGQKAITASFDNTARVWEAATGRELLVLRHPDAVTRGIFSRDGNKIATDSKDAARVWDAATGAELAILSLHKGEYLKDLSPDGRKVLTGSKDGTIRFRDIANGRELSVFRGHSARLSPDGLRVATESKDGTVRVWEAATGAELAVLRGSEPLAKVAPVVFSPGGQKVATVYKDGTTRLWDAATGAELAVLRHPQEVLQVAISPDGQKVITASKDNTARLWDAVSGSELHVLRHPQMVLPAEIAHLPTGRAVWSAAFSSNGQKVVTASSDNTARVWDVATGAEFAVLSHPHSIISATFSPDGLKVLTAPSLKSGHSMASVWDIGRELLALRHEQDVRRAVFSPDGQKVLTLASGSQVRIWDTVTGTESLALSHPRPVSFATFSRNGHKVVTASPEDGTARVWDAVTGVELLVLRHEKGPELATFSRDGEKIVTTSKDGTARIWDAASGAERLVLRHPRPTLAAEADRKVPGVRAELERLGLLGPTVLVAAFSPDAQKVLTVSRDRISVKGVEPIFENAVRLWDAATGVELLVLHEGAIQNAALSPDGQRVAATLADGTARLWDAATGAEIAVLRSQEGPIRDVFFDHNGGKVVTGSGDGTARLWDATTGTALTVLRGHAKQIQHADFSVDGQRVLTAGADRTARLWDATSGALLAVLKQENEVDVARFSLDGQRALTSSGSIVRLWQLPAYRSAEGLIAYASALVLPGLSEAECREFGIPAPRCNFSKPVRPHDHDQAIADDDDAIKLDPSNAPAFRKRGNAYYDKGDIDRAIADFSEAIRLDPEFAKAHLSRAIAYNEKGDHDRAIADFDKAIRLDPEIAQAYLNRAIVYTEKGDYDLAIADSDATIRLDPEIAQAYVVRGNAYGEKGDYDRAIADFDDAIRLRPTNAATWTIRCAVHAIRGQLEPALNDCNESLRLTPRSADTRGVRGFVYLKLGRLDDAIIDYDEALKLDPKHPTALYGRGLAKLEKGDADGHADIASAKAIKADIAQDFVRYGVPAR